MVKSNNGKSVHDEAQGYEDSPVVDDVGLDSGGFFDYDAKQVAGAENVPVDRSGYGTRERDWTTQGEFQMGDQQVMEVFAEIMDEPAQNLDSEPEAYTDGGYDIETMADVDHTGPFGDYSEGGAPW